MKMYSTNFKDYKALSISLGSAFCLYAYESLRDHIRERF
jgi:hypothetical protein